MINCEPKRDCKMYKNDDTLNGCLGLNKLYCKLEKKECKFFKQKTEINKNIIKEAFLCVQKKKKL